MLGSVVFHSPDGLEISTAVRCRSERPLAELLAESAGSWRFESDVHTACAAFVGWLHSQSPAPATLSVVSLPGVPWAGDDHDAWEWYDRVMAEVAAWEPPPVLVDLEYPAVTHRGEVLWPPPEARRERPADRRSRPPGEPFPLGWYGQSFEGHREGDGTYDCYPPEQLPPIRVPLTGAFDWLRAAPEHDGSVFTSPDPALAEKVATLPPEFRQVNPIGADRDRIAAALARLLASTPVALPTEFVAFFESPTLWRRIRSCTDCYFDLDDTAVEIRGGLGWLVRFASDSQGCLHWSLYLSPCRTEHAVVTTYFYTGSDCHHPRGGPIAHPRDITTCAASFEEFVYRYWLENELWYALHGLGAMPVGGLEYLGFYPPKVGPE